VFADALVPAGAVARVAQSHPNSELTVSRSRAPAQAAASLHGIALLAAMVIVSPNRTVNQIPQIARQSGKITIFPISRNARTNRVQIRFIAMLKLPFKFDRS
jgi:hypothetical protein